MTGVDTSIQRILLVALDNLGDLVFASSLAPPLLARYPQASLDVWCKKYTEDVAQLIPGVRHVIAAEPFWARSPGRVRGSVRAFVESIREVRRGSYDVAVLAGAPWRTAAAVRATGVPVRIGLARHRNGAFLTHRLPAEDVSRPVLSELARLLIPLGAASDAPRYRLDPRPLETWRSELARSLSRPFVALHPFAGGRDRCVPISVWLQVAVALRERGMDVLWIGTPEELAEVRRTHMHRFAHFIDQLGDASMSNSVAALSLATMYVGHDSGPLHVAGAFGVPVVGVFAPGQPQRTFPQGVGPSRMLARSTPGEIDAPAILCEIDALLPSLTSAP